LNNNACITIYSTVKKKKNGFGFIVLPFKVAAFAMTKADYNEAKKEIFDFRTLNN
jgi:hypothetical protein